MGVINDYGMPFTDQAGDRKYNSSQWREYFGKLIKDGIIQNAGNQAEVKQQAVANKSVFVDTGTVFIQGVMRIASSTTTLNCADNTSGNPRIDRVVARLNYTTRAIEFAVKQGTPAASPVAPSLTRNTSVYELALADITLANGFSTILAANINDKRWDVDLCGAASMTIGVIPPKGLDAVTVQLEPETQDMYGAENVDDALVMLAPSAYLGSFGFDKHLKNSLGDVTFTVNGNFPSAGVVVYNNLTISGGVTVGTTCPHRQIIIVIGTLTLNGVIDFSGKGGSGGASNGSANQGGAGGGVVVILANKILGTGQVLANGVNGANANGSYLLVLANAGVNGRIFNCVTNAGSRGSTDFYTPSSPGTAPEDKDLVKGGLYLSQLPAVDTGGAGGSSGTSSKNASYTAGGGGGGAGTYGAGGSGGGGNTGNGGGAGGGGGLIAIVSPNPIPAISLSAKGGNGGNGGSVNAGGGGGGGGGQAIIVAPSSLAVTDVSGGIGGLKAGTGTGGNGVNGGSGLATFM